MSATLAFYNISWNATACKRTLQEYDQGYPRALVSLGLEDVPQAALAPCLVGTAGPAYRITDYKRSRKAATDTHIGGNGRCQGAYLATSPWLSGFAYKVHATGCRT
jgi:hypothetical protein